MKSINRNPFQEKLLHRYILEGLYTGRPSVKRLLPDIFKNKKINVVIPEAQTNNGLRIDFKIFFKGIKKPFWLEIKWTSDSSKNQKQISFLKKNGGMIAALGGDFTKYPDGIHISLIDQEDVQYWLKFSSNRLWKDALSEYGIVPDPKKWLLVLRGGYIHNWDKMIEFVGSETKGLFWAFQNQKRSFESIFNMGQGDKLYLLDLKLGFGPQSIPRDPKTVGNVKIKVGLSTISEPHYFSESNEVGSIFEKSPKTPIQDRKWIHFLKFNKSYQGEQVLLNKNDQKMVFSFWDKICDSGNIGGGSPRELTDSEAEFFDSFLMTSTGVVNG